MRKTSIHFKNSIIGVPLSLLLCSQLVLADFKDDVKESELRIMAAERLYLHHLGMLPVSESHSPEVLAVLNSIQNQKFSPRTKGLFEALQKQGLFSSLKGQSPALARSNDWSGRKPRLDLHLSRAERPLVLLNDIYSEVQSLEKARQALERTFAVSRNRKPPTLFKKIFFWLQEKPKEILNIPQLCHTLRTTLNAESQLELIYSLHDKMPPLTHIEFFDILAEFPKEIQSRVSSYLRPMVFTQLDIFDLNLIAGFFDTIEHSILLNELESSQMVLSISNIVKMSLGYEIPLKKWSGIFQNQLIANTDLIPDLRDLPNNTMTVEDAKVLLHWILHKVDAKQEKYSESQKAEAITIVSGKLDPKKQLEFNQIAATLQDTEVDELLELRQVLDGRREMSTAEVISFLYKLSGAPKFTKNQPRSVDGLNRLDGFKALLRKQFPRSEWTSAELHSMHVSLNVAYAAQALSLTRVAPSAQIVDEIRVLLEKIITRSEVTEVKAPYPKPQLGDPQARGVTVHGLRLFFIQQLNQINPNVKHVGFSLLPEEKLNEGLPLLPQFEDLDALEGIGGADLKTEELVQVLERLYSIPVYAKHIEGNNREGLGLLVDLRNRLNAWSGTTNWTASDLQQMNVSRNLAIAAKVLARFDRMNSEEKYRRVVESIHSIFATSDVRDIDMNNFKPALGYLKDRGVTVENLRRYFDEKLAGIKPCKESQKVRNFVLKDAVLAEYYQQSQ